MCQLCQQYVHPEFESILHGEEELALEDEQGYEFSPFSSFWQWINPTQPTVAPPTNDKARLSAAYAQGTVNENDLSNMLFYVRYPHLSGKKLTTDMPDFSKLSQDWLKIRDTIVRPFLDEKRSGTGGAVIGTPDTSGKMPPVEGPYKGITGYICPSGKKCWKGSRASDIIDSDCPWNKPGNRSAANYISVLDYLNVGEPENIGTGNSINKPGENHRYRQETNSRGGVSTWCNIYVHDATRAMWASMPHWVNIGGKWNELTANAMVDWTTKYGKAAGWFRLLSDFPGWTQRSDIPEGLRSAARRILSTSHDPKVANQPSYIAQQFANMGYPTACIWNNVGGIGHVAMVRPEDLKKGYTTSDGVFIPRSAQAGAKNYSNGPLVFGSSGIKSGAVQFHVHE